jgi:hypothetical protein
MKRLFLTLIVFLGVIVMSGTAQEAKNLNKEDVSAVKKACMDYVEGYFESNGERIKAGVNPNLVKRKIKDGKFSELSFDKLVEVTVKTKREKPIITVEVYDIYNDMAAARVTSGFVDFIHLAKIDGKWQVVNVLWNNLIKK